MSDGGTTSSRGRTSVGVVAPKTDASRIVEAVTDAGGVADIGSVKIAAESDAVVAVGESAVRDLATAGVSVPVLPVGVDDVDAVPVENARRAIECLLTGAYEVRERSLVRVETTGESGRALFDIALSTAKPATISEFAVDTFDGAVSHDSIDGDETRVARFRADGVVVATPAGSRGYAHAAGGPVVVPGSDVLSVVPVAPFATDPDHWVVPFSGLSLTVERDETDVELFVDGRPLCTIAPGSTVRLTRDGELRTVVVPESPS